MTTPTFPDLTDYAAVKTGLFRFKQASTPRLKARKAVPPTWPARLKAFFPAYLWHPFSPAHKDLMAWEDAIEVTASPPPFVAIWPRGRGKSTFAEMAVSDLGARGRRLYCLYVSETQDQADKHVATIAAMLESEPLQTYYPDVGRPRIGRNGSRRWNRKILRAANGFVVEAIGLDKAMRGHKVDWARPDLMIFDDVDGKHDTEHAVKKKIATLTTSILPAGAANCAVLFVQNLIHAGSIAHQLSKLPGTDGAADFLANRVVSGPYKAVEGLAYEFRQNATGEWRWVISAGKSLWEGFSLAVCEEEINRDGPTSFDLESQHEIDADEPGALLTTDTLTAARVSSHPDLFRVGVAVDPSGGAGQCGIIGGGLARVGKGVHGYTVADYSTPEGTEAAEWGRAALRCYHALQADFFIVERNFGGDMVRNTLRTAVLTDADGHVLVEGKRVKIVEVSASRGKEVRAQPVAALFQTGVWHHVGYFVDLCRQWTKWLPGTKPSPDRLDAEVWLATYLLLGPQAEMKTGKNPFYS